MMLSFLRAGKHEKKEKGNDASKKNVAALLKKQTSLMGRRKEES
jgi:hypothetical protein